MSYKPNALAFFKPTGCVVPLLFAPYQATESKSLSWSPELNRVRVPARHENSHCASVGKCTFNALSLSRSLSFAQNAVASFQETVSTGSWEPLKSLGFLPITNSY